jgi:hypothetical protein
MVVNFGDLPTEVDVGRAVEPVLTIGQVEVVGAVVRLGPHSAVAADATEHRISRLSPRPNLVLEQK